MGAVCKICGKDMMKAKGCTIPKLHANGKVYDRIKVGAPGDSTKECLIRPGAMTVTPSLGICTIGAAMQSDARPTAVS